MVEQQKTRKIPNLKGLRDMIKRNSQTSPGGTFKTRSVKNESECSFTLTDDEDRENNPAESNGARRGQRNGANRRGASATVTQETLE